MICATFNRLRLSAFRTAARAAFVKPRFAALIIVAAATVLSPAVRCDAATSYSTADKSFGFEYPQSWKVSESGTKILITSDQGSQFTLLRDVLTSLPVPPLAYNDDVKASAAKLIAPIMKTPQFVRGQTALVGHGAGAVFRFQDGPKPDAATASVWIAIIGDHNVVILPSKENQPSESIGMSTVVQSLSFADALPKSYSSVSGGASAAGASPGTVGVTGTPITVSFEKDIMPILDSRCSACHSGTGAAGGLNVGTYSSFVAGGAHPSLIVAGNIGASRLLDYLTGKRDPMPKGSSPLTSGQIALISKWIAEGASNGAVGTLATTSASSTTPAAVRPKRAAARAAAPASTHTLFESYTGRLTGNDAKFELELYKDGTANAEWTGLNGNASHFVGSYTGKEGEYNIVLTRQTGDNPAGTKALHLFTSPRGDIISGRFTADDNPTKYEISGLSLTEFGGTFNKRPAAARRPTTVTRPAQ